MVHYGQADEVRAKRQHVLDDAFAAHPERFVKGRPIAPKAPDQVWINPPQPVPLTDIAPTEAQPGPTVTLAVGPAISDNGMHIAVVEEILRPAKEEKYSLLPSGELTQIV